MTIEKYDHHGREVSVVSEMKGRHREVCLCFACERFKPGEVDNCHAAQSLYELCVAGPITVAPVLECAEYQSRE